MLKSCSQLSIYRRKPCSQPLSDDLVMEILSRLPTKSLRRFLCVSKSWSSFIHHLYLTKRVGILLPISGLFIHPGLFMNPDYPFEEFYVPITPDSYAQCWESFYVRVCAKYCLRPIHSCNGLMLLTSELKYVPIYYVCNFATMEYVHLDTSRMDYCMHGSGLAFPAPLPTSNPPKDYYHPAFCFLAFNPCHSPHYKLVRFSYKDNDNSGSILAQIYSSLTATWSVFTIPQVYPLCLSNWYQMAAFHKGALYIITECGYLVRFQVDKQSLQLLKLPHAFASDYCPSTREERIWSPHSAACIGDLRGNLYYAVNTSMEELHIYTLDEQGVWRLMHRMTTCQLTRDFEFSYFQPVAIHPESGMIYLCTDNGIFSCDPIKSRLEQISNFCPCDVTEDVYWNMVFPVMHYLESIHVPMKPLPMQCCL